MRKQLSDEEFLARSYFFYENRSQQQKQLEREAVEYLEKREKNPPHPYRRKRIHPLQDDQFSLFSFREK